jgi:phosphatidylserine decarboxylase precursor
MRRIFKKVRFFSAILLAGMLFTVNGIGAEIKHKPITEELINLLKKNPQIQVMLEKSIAQARKINPDPNTNPVQTLSAYFDFVDEMADVFPLQKLDNSQLSACNQIYQNIRYFYFLIGQPIPELEGKKLYKNSLQYYPPFSKWLYHFVQIRGKFLDTEESWNEKIYQRIYNDPLFNLQKGWYESPSNWKTFNQFFARHLKSPDMRPIASPDDPSVVISPADSVPQGVWMIDEKSNIRVVRGLEIKNEYYYNIADLLGKNSPYKNAFANGVLTHTYLSAGDYHRYHFAVGGKVVAKKIIPQNVAYEVLWVPELKGYATVDSTGWQFTQTRGYVIVDTGKYGLVALIPMGMDICSSINFEDNVKVGRTFKKGDPLGYFKYGGSDFIMLFQKKAGFEITAPVEKDTETKSLYGAQKGDEYRQAVYKHILMGEEYGRMKGTENANKEMIR